jgi:hypothetical protein
MGLFINYFRGKNFLRIFLNIAIYWQSEKLIYLCSLNLEYWISIPISNTSITAFCIIESNGDFHKLGTAILQVIYWDDFYNSLTHKVIQMAYLIFAKHTISFQLQSTVNGGNSGHLSTFNLNFDWFNQITWNVHKSLKGDPDYQMITKKN